MKHRIALVVARGNGTCVGANAMGFAVGKNMALLKLEGSIL